MYLVERRSAQMHVLHENKEIESRVADSLHEACSCSLALLQADCIPLHAVVRELTFLRREPLGGERLVGKQVDAHDRDTDRDHAFDNEQPDFPR